MRGPVTSLVVIGKRIDFVFQDSPPRDNVIPWTEHVCFLSLQGRIQDFEIEGAQKMASAHHEREARNLSGHILARL